MNDAAFSIAQQWPDHMYDRAQLNLDAEEESYRSRTKFSNEERPEKRPKFSSDARAEEMACVL